LESILIGERIESIREIDWGLLRRVFCDQSAQLIDFLSDDRFKIDNIPFAEERAESVSSPLVNIEASRCAYATWNSQAP
jgi:hypothetical protein